VYRLESEQKGERKKERKKERKAINIRVPRTKNKPCEYQIPPLEKYIYVLSPLVIYI
jgi:hypothetical protein